MEVSGIWWVVILCHVLSTIIRYDYPYWWLIHIEFDSNLAIVFQLYFQEETINDNTTHSELSFVPTTEDNDKSITCRAENPKVTGLFLETSWKIDVVCKLII